VNFLFFTGGWIAGGQEAAFLALMQGLRKRGHRPTAIVSGWTDGAFPQALKEAGIPHHAVSLGRVYIRNLLFTWHTLRRLPEARRQLRAIAAEARPDWVVSPDVQTLLQAAPLLGGRRALFLQSAPERLMRHALTGRLLDRRLDRVLCCSHFIAEAARATPVAADKIAVVPNGVPLPAERPFAARNPLRIGIVGRIVDQKGHMVLLEACALLKQRCDAFRLDIVGDRDGDYAAAVASRAASLGLGGIVCWPGFVTDRDRLYAGLDIVAAPAVDEPFGLTVTEAGAYGLPAVAARSGAFPELVEDGRTGLLFPPGDARALADALERLVRDAGLRRTLGEGGRARVASCFTAEAMTDSFLKALEMTRRTP
jgi:glycosyltransferase involved in cell wall biosynthesis